MYPIRDNSVVDNCLIYFAYTLILDTYYFKKGVRLMLLLTLVYSDSREDIIEDIREMKEYFADRNIVIGISESIIDNTHFIKLFCDENYINKKFTNMFNLYMANILYKIVINEYYYKEIQGFLTETYFFLKYDEIKEIKNISINALKSDDIAFDENVIFFINKKNDIIEKIIDCISENKEINIKGFITFRMKEFRQDIESIIDKVVENYMVEKEYNEFIKLLKYFVDIQECKIDEVHIIVQKDGNYTVRDKEGNDILDKLFCELSESRFTGTVTVEDMLISGLITNAPNKIFIHDAENCINKEILDTIKNVFLDRVSFCDDCKTCKGIREKIKL